MNSPLQVQWIRRSTPLEPLGAVATRGVARRLGARMLEIGLEGLSGFAAGDALFVMGATERLPWVDGAMYLGADREVSALWTPTLFRPDQHPALVLRSVCEALKLAGPIAVIPSESLALPISRARVLDPTALRNWVSR